MGGEKLNEMLLKNVKKEDFIAKLRLKINNTKRECMGTFMCREMTEEIDEDLSWKCLAQSDLKL